MEKLVPNHTNTVLPNQHHLAGNLLTCSEVGLNIYKGVAVAECKHTRLPCRPLQQYKHKWESLPGLQLPS